MNSITVKISWEGKKGAFTAEQLEFILKDIYKRTSGGEDSIKVKEVQVSEEQPCVATRKRYLQCDFSLMSDKPKQEYCECKVKHLYSIGTCNICELPFKPHDEIEELEEGVIYEAHEIATRLNKLIRAFNHKERR